MEVNAFGTTVSLRLAVVVAANILHCCCQRDPFFREMGLTDKIRIDWNRLIVPALPLKILVVSVDQPKGLSANRHLSIKISFFRWRHP